MSVKVRGLEDSLELLAGEGPNEHPSGRPHSHRPESFSSPTASASPVPSAAQSALSEPGGQRRDSSDSDTRPVARTSQPVRASRSAPLNSTLQPSGNCSCALVVHDFLGDLSREFETLSKLCSFPSSFLQGYTQLTASKPGICYLTISINIRLLQILLQFVVIVLRVLCSLGQLRSQNSCGSGRKSVATCSQ
jgi:hypothetical protein